ncbi:BZ3500_MvSof-1268-A1-R1_Chr11-1g03209 [Microbotryum saponariae]|uniref:BZ3500_MvSof-1268-A1-R1_Chr11-1g03209 protein n=1 Tax=Microbotryum saponariae TaxID=289078 RepID=A0A2X0NCD8_9BASI|nr:BZ3501_MvSof-1269-A2-R1_Chr11g02784 [Microbotryum saponariae]SDA03769.1 BZ3500_MvSof-1268-A1-R1_Chr11-1g03209 [Microbotryum saponariae]
MGPHAQIKVLPATEADLPFLAVVKRRSLGHLPISKAIWGKVPDPLVDDYRVREFTQMLHNDKVTLQKAEVDGKIVGMGVWHQPGYKPDPEIEFPPGANIEVCDEFFASMALDHGRPGYHLAVLGVLPEYQGRAIGRAILGWGLAQADASNHSIFLESTEGGFDGIRTYLKNGFYHIRELLASGPDGNFTVNPMHRPSRFELSPDPSRFSIQPVMPEDLARIAEIQLSSGTANSHSNQEIIATYKAQLKDDRAFRIYKAVDRLSGNIVAAASWRTPYALLRDDSPSPFGNGRIGLVSLVVDAMAQVQGLEEGLLAAVNPEAMRMGWTIASTNGAHNDGATQNGGARHGQWVYLYPGSSTTSHSLRTISPATPEDFSEIARVRRQAFEPSLVHQTLFGKTDPEDFDRWTVTRLQKSFQAPHQATWVARLGGKIVGFARWDLPHDQKVSEKDAKMEVVDERGEVSPKYIPGTEAELADHLFGQLGKTEGTTQCYQLGSFCVDPKYQGQGIGSALIRWGLDRADEDGLPCYTDASVVGQPAYKKAGFETYTAPVYGGRNKELVVSEHGAERGAAGQRDGLADANLLPSNSFIRCDASPDASRQSRPSVL